MNQSALPNSPCDDKEGLVKFSRSQSTCSKMVGASYLDKVVAAGLDALHMLQGRLGLKVQRAQAGWIVRLVHVASTGVAGVLVFGALCVFTKSFYRSGDNRCLTANSLDSRTCVQYVHRHLGVESDGQRENKAELRRMSMGTDCSQKVLPTETALDILAHC